MRLLSTIAILSCFASSAVQAATIAYYQFEGTSGNTPATIADSSGNGNTGTVIGSPLFNSSVPATSFTDTTSLSLATSDALAFNYAFPFDTDADATLEFYVNPSSVSSEQDVFWTTTAGGDTNRFNIAITSGGGFSVDYRSADSTLRSVVSVSTGAITAGEWNFVALVKSGNTYSLYVNGASPATSTDSSPNLPTSTGWTISGRQTEQGVGCCQFSGLIDEVRLSDTALTSSEFLNATQATPEPGTMLTFASAMVALAVARRRRR